MKLRSHLLRALQKGAELGLKPLAVVVLDNRASLRICLNQDGTAIHRHRVAHGKANAAMSLGMGSRALGARAEAQAYFVDAVGRMMDGDFIPVPGGVLIRNTEGVLLGRSGFPAIHLKMMRQQLLLRLRRSVLSLKPGLDLAPEPFGEGMRVACGPGLCPWPCGRNDVR